MSSARLTGIGAAPGIAVGPAWRHREAAAPGGLPLPPPPRAVDVDAVAAQAARQLDELAARLRTMGRAAEAAIFDAQSMMSTDTTLLDAWRRRMSAGEDAVAAVTGAAGTVSEKLASLGDELLAARAADVRDVGQRLARIVAGAVLDLPTQPSIVIADDLPPSTTAEIPSGFLLGIALEAGSRTAHAVILARALGIPCIVGVDGLLARYDALVGPTGGPDGASPGDVVVGIDGDAGEVLLRPSSEELEELGRRGAARHAVEAMAREFRDRPAALSDGERVKVLANIGGPADAQRALDARAEGVGLFRTEFLFMHHQTPPTEREQADAYREVFEAFGPDRPVVVRLADIGGDKGIPYLDLPAEANPFLGVRAIRLAYRDRDLLVTQLRAISTAAAAAGVVPQIMAPMVATLEDVALLHGLVDEAQAGLRSAGAPMAERLVTGIMVEIPSAALIAAELARHVDFFSIGTNDLTQYLLAADRTNALLAPLQEALHPAVLRCIRMVVEGADAVGIPVAVCGELAGDPAGALVLVGLGVDELSADAGSLDGLRQHLAGVSRADLDALAALALRASDGPTVRHAAEALLTSAESRRAAVRPLLGAAR